MKSNTEKYWDVVLEQKETVDLIKDIEKIIESTKDKKSCRIELKSGRAMEIRQILMYHLNNQGFSTRLSDGDMYHKLGFQLKNRVDLDYCYLIDGVRHHRWSFRKDMIKEKFPNIYDENKKEYQMMLELGYDRIWDCGKLKFVMHKHNSNA